jgi:hypothetical protein
VPHHFQLGGSKNLEAAFRILDSLEVSVDDENLRGFVFATRAWMLTHMSAYPDPDAQQSALHEAIDCLEEAAACFEKVRDLLKLRESFFNLAQCAHALVELATEEERRGEDNECALLWSTRHGFWIHFARNQDFNWDSSFR